MNVSVTVLESSQIFEIEPLLATFHATDSRVLEKDRPGAGRLKVASHPDSELFISVYGNGSLTDGNGKSVSFSPELNIGQNVAKERNLTSDGNAVSVLFIQPDAGGYRGVAELQLFGTIDTGNNTTGQFSTVYTIKVEHH